MDYSNELPFHNYEEEYEPNNEFFARESPFWEEDEDGIPKAIPRHLQVFPHKTCDVPYCDINEMTTAPFDNTNVECWQCDKFTCKKCCDQIWNGEWNGEIFYKPKINCIGLIHQVWKCPHCRSSFDRMKNV